VILRNLLLISAIAAPFFLSYNTGTATLYEYLCNPVSCYDYHYDWFAQMQMTAYCGPDDPEGEGYAFAWVYESCDDLYADTSDDAWGEAGDEAIVAYAESYLMRWEIAWSYATWNCAYGDGGNYDEELGCYWWEL
jgi:hypothetical protein